MKKILITGANGFLGKHLLTKLSNSADFEVFTLTRSKEKLNESYSHYTHFDLSDFKNNKIPFKEIDYVVHTAFARANKGGRAIAESIDFTRELMETLKQYKNINFVNFSSQEIYGGTPPTWKESNDNINPNTIYGTAKYCTELLSHSILGENNLNYTNIRLAGVLGSETKDRMVNKFVDFAINTSEINIIGGKQVFSQIHIDDVISGVLALLRLSPDKWETVYNLGYLKSYSIMEIANIVKKTGNKFKMPEIVVNLTQKELPFIAELDSSMFYSDANWKPQKSMEDVVSEIFEFKLLKNNE